MNSKELRRFLLSFTWDPKTGRWRNGEEIIDYLRYLLRQNDSATLLKEFTNVLNAEIIVRAFLKRADSLEIANSVANNAVKGLTFLYTDEPNGIRKGYVGTRMGWVSLAKLYNAEQSFVDQAFLLGFHWRTPASEVFYRKLWSYDAVKGDSYEVVVNNLMPEHSFKLPIDADNIALCDNHGQLTHLVTVLRFGTGVEAFFTPVDDEMVQIWASARLPNFMQDMWPKEGNRYFIDTEETE